MSTDLESNEPLHLKETHYSDEVNLLLNEEDAALIAKKRGGSHLSKRPSDLKQNGTQEKTPFSGSVL